MAATQAATGGAAAVFPPAIAAITLGIVSPKAVGRRIGRNEAFNHAGNATAATIAGVTAYFFGPIAVFWLMAAMAVASVAATLAIPARAIDHELATTLMSVCIVAAQAVMVPVAMVTGAKADAWGRKPIFLVALAVLALRGALYPLSDNPYWLVGVQLLDGVGAGIFGALVREQRTRPFRRSSAVQGGRIWRGAVQPPPNLGVRACNSAYLWPSTLVAPRPTLL